MEVSRKEGILIAQRAASRRVDFGRTEVKYFQLLLNEILAAENGY